MYQGATQLNLDSKGRLTIPTEYRDLLLSHCAGHLVMTADEDGCLLVYAKPEWEPIRAKINALPSLNVRARSLQRLLVGHAKEVEMDAAGRVLVPPTLRSYAGLDKHAMLVGQGNKFELWDEGRWQAQMEKLKGFMAGELPAELEGFTL